MRRILIAGDRTVDWFFYSQRAEDTGENWRRVPSTQEFCLPGGVLLLEQLIRAALEMRKLTSEISATPLPTGDWRLVSAQEVIQSSAHPESFPAGKEICWRVAQSLGFQGPARGVSTEVNAVPQPTMSDPDLIVLDDHGNAFRNDRSAWPEALTHWQAPLRSSMRFFKNRNHSISPGTRPKICSPGR